MPPTSQTRKPPRNHLLAVGLYSTLYAAVAWPVLRDPAHLTFSSFSLDNYTNFWNLWWVSEALRQGMNLFRPEILYHPIGTTLTFTEFCPLYGVLSAPLLWVFKSPYTAVLAFNLWVAASFILTGYATYLFCKWESQSETASLFAGLLVAFSAYRFHHIEHMNLLSTFWLPLTAWLAGTWLLSQSSVKPGTKPAMPSRWRLAGVAGCGLGMAATSYTMLAFTGLFLFVWFVGVLIFQRERFLPGILSKAGQLVVALGAGSAPLTWWWLSAASGGDATFGVREKIGASPDLLGFFIPQRSMALGPIFESLGKNLHGTGGMESFLGYALLSTALYGMWSRRRWGAPLLITALVAFLISLGPRGVWVAGTHHVLPVTMHDVLMKIAPIFTASRTPGRFIVITLFALAPLSAIGMSAIFRKPRGKLIGTLAIAIALIELIPRIPSTQRVELSPGLLALATDPQEGAVIEMPFPLGGLPVAPGEEFIGTLNLYTFHQVAHKRPMVGGPLFRPSPEAMRFLREKRFYERLSNRRDLPNALQDLELSGVTFVIWNRGDTDQRVWAAMQSTYSRYLQTRYTDEAMTIYAIP